MAVTVLSCSAGAALTFVASRQTWAVQVTSRQPPLSPLRETFSGAQLTPWLPAVALVGLAAGLALLATRHRSRVLVGCVAVASGLAIMAGVGHSLTTVPGGASTVAAAGVWPLASLTGGLMVVAAGTVAVRRARHWPAMGVRYDRAGGRPGAVASSARSDPERLWDALDAGTDPTDVPGP